MEREKIAIFSDVHSNLEALNAVLEDMKHQGVTQRVCLGDVVGYGADPHRCLEVVKECSDYFIAGNHDLAACDESNVEHYSTEARKGIEFSRIQLNVEDKKYIRSLPLTLLTETWEATHASLFKPHYFLYVVDHFQAELHFTVQKHHICFCGHTHLPIIWEKAGETHIHPALNCHLKNTSRYLINVGSVGQPRDNNCQACYVIYEPQADQITFRRIKYDIPKTQRKIQSSGLPDKNFLRLTYGQ